MRLFIAAFDPGETTGWARWFGDVAPSVHLGEALGAGNMMCGQEHAAQKKFEHWPEQIAAANSLVYQTVMWQLENEFDEEVDDFIIVIEDFILRQGPHGSKREGLAPVRMTSYILAACSRTWEWPIKVVTQSAADAKGRVTDDRLRDYGWWVRGAPHSRDALRHTALYVVRYRDALRRPG